ncbi:hypothetical protein ACWEEK_24135 [Micromonospora aurantiaca (nom. illeg.)]
MLDDKDPTGAARLKEWADGLRELAPGTPPTFEFQRMIHPGMVPADGDGLLAATVRACWRFRVSTSSR